MENSERRESKDTRFREGKPSWNKGLKGKLSHSYGKKHSEERKEKVSLSLKKHYDKVGRKSKKNELIRKSKDYIQWRLKLFERDNFTCKICKSKKELHPHHIKEFAKYPELRFNVENGLTVCQECHGKIHGIDFKRNKKKLVCKNCKIKFPVKNGQYGHQFCSKRCGYDYRSKIPSSKKGKRYPHLDKYPIKECPSCGLSFKAVVHISRNQKYCSHKCYLKKRWNYTGEVAVKVGK